MDYRNKIFFGDAVEQMKLLPDGIAQTCVTSPPYYGLRDYGADGQLGLESSPEKFVEAQLPVFAEVHRLLNDTGTLWLNYGDSYSATGKSRTSEQAARKSTLAGSKGTQISCANQPSKITKHLPAKNLVGIPWRMALALQGFAVIPQMCLLEWADLLQEAQQKLDWELVGIVEQKIRSYDLLQGLKAQGWYLRQDIIWHKPNPMPESVTDRCTKAHEYIFLLSKSQKYYFDAAAISMPAKNPEEDERRYARQDWDNKNTPDVLRNGIRPRKSGNKERKSGSERGCPENTGSNVMGSVPWEGTTANRRSVWTINTKPFHDAHFAVFPIELPVLCVQAGSKPGDLVIDPFMGSGTTAVAAKKLDREYWGSELNHGNIKICEKRLYNEFGMFL